MTNTEYAEWVSEVLGRQVNATDEFTADDFRKIRAAETELQITEREAAAEAARKRKAYEERLAADPLFPARERAAELRAEAEERAKLVADARILAHDKLKDHFPADFIEGLSDDEAIAAAFSEQGEPYTTTNDQGHSFIVDPKDANKPSVTPLSLEERQKAWTAAEEAKERRQWNKGKDD